VQHLLDYIAASKVKNLKFIFFLVLLSTVVFAQKTITVRGTVVDEQKQPLPFANVGLLNASDSSSIVYTQTKDNGRFEFKDLVPKDYLLKISYLNYVDFYLLIKNKDQTLIDIDTLSLKPNDNTLSEVVVKGDKEPLAIKKDTMEFDAAVLKPQQNDNLEDLIKKVPTLEIDENGAIKTQNKTIRKLLIDGKEFFGNDPNIALKNLPAEAIEKIQVIEKKTEQAEFSGVDDGEREMIINVTLKPSYKRGIIGFGSAGAAPPLASQPAFYNLKTSINRFTSDNQLSVIGLLNNVNQQGFTPQDVSNFSSLNRQNNRGSSNTPQNASVNLPVVVGTRPGLIATEGIGLNYNDQYGKNSSLQSSYFFTAGHTNLSRNLTRQSFLPNKTIHTNQQSQQDRNNLNHRLNATWNHEFNKKNTIRLVSGLNYVSGDYDSKSTSKISTITNGSSIENSSNRRVINASHGQSFNNSLLYRHRFDKVRRSVSVNLVFNQSQDQNNDSTNTTNYSLINNQTVVREINQVNERHTNQQNQRLQLSYNEPIGKNQTIELSYAYQRNINNANFMVWDITNGLRKQNINLSNSFRNNFLFQQTGIKFNHDAKEKTFVAGLLYQKSVLNSYFNRGTDNTLSRVFENVLPSFRYSFRKSNIFNTSIEYNTAVNEPSVRDLQPITINNNPQSITVGNPDLKPEYSHRINLSQNFFNPKTFSNFNCWGYFNVTNNAIGYAQTVSETLVRTTKPVNMPYRWNSSLSATYSFALGQKQKNKIRLSFNPRWSFSQGNSLVNGVNNLNSQNQWRGEGRITYLTDKINFVFNTNYQKSFVTYSVNQEFNQTYALFRNTTELRWKANKKTTFTTELDYTNYQNSRLQAAQTTIPILNLGIKRLFLKNNRGELSIIIQDTMNRNVYLSQRSDDNFFEVERSNTLGRYVMFNFMYSIKKQGKGVK
jgi:Outer membrane protein beta-barrel family/CarboxypepD_reg-like domain